MMILKNKLFQTNTLQIILFAFFLIVLPLHNLLFLNIGFPLKLHELSFGILIFLFGIRFYQIQSIHPRIWVYIKILMLFFVFVILSFINGIINFDTVSLYSDLARINPITDSALKTIYIFIAILVFVVSRYLLSRHIFLIQYYFIGTWLAATVSIVFLCCGFFDIKPINFFDMHYQGAYFGDAYFIRNGTFLEGNFAGLYFIISFILAKHLNKNILSLVLLPAIVSTLSTIAILTIMIYLSIISLLNHKNFSHLLLTLLLLLCVNVKTDGFFFKEQFIDKIPLTAAHSTIAHSTIAHSTIAHSTIERSEMIRTGLKIFIQKPLLGTGPSNYKYYFPYLHQYKKEQLSSLGINTERPLIVNNIYIELLAEYGIFAFLAFFIFVWKLFYNVQKQKLYYLSSGLIVVMIYFIAYPSFSVLFLWVFFAILSMEKSQHAYS